MQCAACRAVYSTGLECCPRCQSPASSSPAHATEKRSVAADKNAPAVATRRETRTPATVPSERAGRVATETPPPAISTLIEFPGTGRNARPPWRKELSERVREIQARRAREAALEEEMVERQLETEPLYADEPDGPCDHPSAEGESAPPLGLVPPVETPEMNPLVVAALRRIERAHQAQTPPSMSHANARGAAATAVARVAEEQYEPSHAPEVVTPAAAPRAEGRTTSAATSHEDSQALKREKTAEGARSSSGLVVVSTPASVRHEPATANAQEEPLKISALAEPPKDAVAKDATVKTESRRALPQTDESRGGAVETKSLETKSHQSTRQPRRHTNGVIDDSWLTRLDAEILPPVVSAKGALNDRAPLAARFVGAAVDLVIVVFLSSPCAAVIELTSGNWADPRVAASMGGILLVVMFLYLTGSTALAGRTLGMKLFSLHTVDAATALAPSTGQSMRRTLVYMLSLVTFGLGILYALFDAEGRTAHDHLSGTVIVRE